MLLNHTSGIPDYAWDPWFIVRWFGLPKKEWRAAELIDVIRNQPPRFTPGARHEYSNSNYVLLGSILERVMAKEYATLLTENAFDRLGLRDTFFATIRVILPLPTPTTNHSSVSAGKT